MIDAELAKYLGVDDHPNWPRFVAKLDPVRRATYERMAQVEHELNLWTAGLGPKPEGVIVCHEHKRARR